MANLEKITSEDFATWLKLELNMGYLNLTDIQKAIQAFRQYNNADKAHNALLTKKEKKAAKIVWVIWKKYGGPQKALEAFKAHYDDAEAFAEEAQELIKNNPDIENEFDWEIHEKVHTLTLVYEKSEEDDSVDFYKENNKYYFDYQYTTNITHSRDWHGPHGYEDVYDESTDKDSGGPFDSLQAAYNDFIENHFIDGNFAYYHKQKEKYENYFDGEDYYDRS